MWFESHRVRRFSTFGSFTHKSPLWLGLSNVDQGRWKSQWKCKLSAIHEDNIDRHFYWMWIVSDANTADFFDPINSCLRGQRVDYEKEYISAYLRHIINAFTIREFLTMQRKSPGKRNKGNLLIGYLNEFLFFSFGLFRFDNPAAHAAPLTRRLTHCYLIPVNLLLLLLPSGLCADWTVGSLRLIREWTDPRNGCTVVAFAWLLFMCFWTLIPRLSTQYSRALVLVSCWLLPLRDFDHTLEDSVFNHNRLQFHPKD